MEINWKRWLLITIALLNITFITTACAPPMNPNQVVFSILSDPKLLMRFCPRSLLIFLAIPMKD